MAPSIVYSGAITRSQPGDSPAARLFAGKKFWFSQAIPQRQWLIQNAEANGAVVVQLESQADIKLVDHAKRNAAPGTHSYRYVEVSIRNGRLEDLEHHAVGTASRVNRPVGSVRTATKNGRTPFNDADDQLLWDWVKPFMDVGGMWKGNEIYKQLEQHNSRHTYQSWRDRWIKHTQYQNRKVSSHIGPGYEFERGSTATPETRSPSPPPERTAPNEKSAKLVDRSQLDKGSRTTTLIVGRSIQSTMGNEHSTPSARPKSTVEMTDENSQMNVTKNSHEKGEENRDRSSVSDINLDLLPLAHTFTQDDAQDLYRAALAILITNPDDLDSAWTNLACTYPQHTKEEWRTYFEEYIAPEYRRRNDLRDNKEFLAHLEVKNAQFLKQYAEEVECGRRAQQEASLQAMSVHQTELRPAAAANESRKRSSVRSTNSNSQSQPTTQSKSQSTDTSGTVSDIPYRTEFPQIIEENTEGQNSDHETRMVKIEDVTQMSVRRSSPKRERELSEDIPDADAKKRKTQHDTVPVQSQPHIVELFSSPDSDRTQDVLAGTPRGTHGATADNSHSIVERVSSSEVPTKRSDSPLFLTDDSSESSPESDHEDVDTGREIHSSNLPYVNVVDDGEDGETGGYLGQPVSQHASSETPSEGVQFDATPTLSQPWATGPAEVVELERDELPLLDELVGHPPHVLAYSEVDSDAVDWTDSSMTEQTPPTDEAVTRAISHRPYHSQSEPSPRDTEAGSGAHSFKADQHRYLDTAHGAIHDRERIDRKGKNKEVETLLVGHSQKKRLSTQALFQASLDPQIEEDTFLVPSPDGGWDDDEDVQVTGEYQLNTVDTTHPTIKQEDKMPNQTKRPDPVESDGANEIDQFMTDQTNLHSDPNTDPALLDAILIRALETTSLNTSLARKAVISMLQILKTKPTPLILIPSSTSSKTSKKRLRKKQIDEIVEELIPRGIKGVWTREDDAALMGQDARLVQAVDEKHGEENVKVRFEYFEQFVEGG